MGGLGAKKWRGWRGSITFWRGSKYMVWVAWVKILTSVAWIWVVLFKKCIIKNFAKLTGKHPCWSFSGDSSTGVFCEFCKIFKNTYFVGRLHTFITMFCLPRRKPQLRSLCHCFFPYQIPSSFAKWTLVTELG